MVVPKEAFQKGKAVTVKASGGSAVSGPGGAAGVGQGVIVGPKAVKIIIKTYHHK